MYGSTAPIAVGTRPSPTPGLKRPGGRRAAATLAAALSAAALTATALVGSAVPPAEAGTDGVTTPVTGTTGTSFSFRPWLSANGRYVGFDSDAKNLVAGDTNGARDVFVHDRATGKTERVSLGVDRAEPDGDSERPTLSADGHFVAFWSEATNLVEGDTNGVADAFVVDRKTAAVRRVSIGDDGRQANGASARPVISADGKFVAFESGADNLLPGVGLLDSEVDDNEARDIFVHDMTTRETTRVSVLSGGGEAKLESVRPSISADGRFVAFHSDAVLEPADTNDHRDAYLHDRSDATTVLVSVSDNGSAGNGGSFSPSVSSDGSVVAFWSNADNLVAGDGNDSGDVFVRNVAGGTTTRVSLATGGAEGDADSSDPSISPDGRYVAYWSSASTLADGDTNDFRDVYLHDREAGTTTRVSVASDGRQANADSYSPNIAAGGNLVAYDSEATTLVPGDTNPGSDIFLYSPDA